MAAPGNLGLYDQIAALRWVKRNIQNFGGNNDEITVMGHNAGAISASLLLLAPHETQGRFYSLGQLYSTLAILQVRKLTSSISCCRVPARTHQQGHHHRRQCILAGSLPLEPP